MGSHVIETRQILDALRRIVQVLRLSAAKAEKAGVSGAQLFVLQQLVSGPLSIAQVAERTHTDPSSASTLLKRLEARELIQRGQAKDDQRRAEVRLTSRGKTIAKRAAPLAQTQLFSALAKLPKGQQRALARGLLALTAAMGLPAAAPLFFEEGKKK